VSCDQVVGRAREIGIDKHRGRYLSIAGLIAGMATCNSFAPIQPESLARN
jgi:hypothetical protein